VSAPRRNYHRDASISSTIHDGCQRRSSGTYADSLAKVGLTFVLQGLSGLLSLPAPQPHVFEVRLPTYLDVHTFNVGTNETWRDGMSTRSLTETSAMISKLPVHCERHDSTQYFRLGRRRHVQCCQRRLMAEPIGSHRPSPLRYRVWAALACGRLSFFARVYNHMLCVSHCKQTAWTKLA